MGEPGKRPEERKRKGRIRQGMKILVVGGSYFLGRVFVMLTAKEHEITVVNRGSYPMDGFGVKQVKGDRRETATWKACTETYDVAVDFCAYEKGDIATVLENLPEKVGQYIFISTVDVYERGVGGRKEESAPLERRIFAGEAGAYIAGKVALEGEVAEECEKRGIPYTVLRPAILYGPLNYAPRESIYIQMMVQNHILPRITDAVGKFQMVYVKDAAEAVRKCLGNRNAYGRAYNLCQDLTLTYDLFLDGLKEAADSEAQEIRLTAAEAAAQGMPLPFPVTEEETELYSNERSKRELGLLYTDFAQGMAKTYRAFRGIYDKGQGA